MSEVLHIFCHNTGMSLIDDVKKQYSSFAFCRKYSLSGSYRKILQIPIDLSWKIMHYENKTDDLIPSDIDAMRKVDPPKDIPGKELNK